MGGVCLWSLNHAIMCSTTLFYALESILMWCRIKMGPLIRKCIPSVIMLKKIDHEL